MKGIGGCTVVILEKEEKIAKYDKFKNIVSLRKINIPLNK